MVNSRRARSIIGTILGVIVIILLQRAQLLSEQSSEPTSHASRVVPQTLVVESVTSTHSASSPAESFLVTTTTHLTMNARVVRVVDGDTLVVRRVGESNDEKVRLLGVNTPETVDPRRMVECFGKDASGYMHGFVEGKDVFLAEDVLADDRDKYHRLLRNVYLLEGIDVNASLVRQGYAQAYLSFPLNKARKQQLSRLQEEAKANQRGLWSVETCNGQKKK